MKLPNNEIFGRSKQDKSLISIYLRSPDEGKGNIAADASVNGHDGTIVATPSRKDGLTFGAFRQKLC